MSAEMPRLDLRKECERDYPTVEYSGLSFFFLRKIRLRNGFFIYKQKLSRIVYVSHFRCFFFVYYLKFEE
jgi:hypothetical protein